MGAPVSVGDEITVVHNIDAITIVAARVTRIVSARPAAWGYEADSFRYEFLSPPLAPARGSVRAVGPGTGIGIHYLRAEGVLWMRGWREEAAAALEALVRLCGRELRQLAGL